MPGAVAAQPPAGPSAGGHGALYEALLAHGWDIGARGLPCNQFELAYTLLTFHYVFLRGMRTLGLGLAPSRRRRLSPRLERGGSRAGRARRPAASEL
ncbi:MAG: hypothetical protein IPG16_12480 [Comamonadaceae bacterium]|nr:hypothetical protein [Comamonadaceae bacterium]